VSGQFTLHRDVFSHELFEGEPFSRREAWIWLIGHAMWRDHVTTIQGQRVVLARGQVAATLSYLAKRWLWTHSKV